jgi:hypothetical protein
MAYTYNDVQNSGTGYALGDSASTTTTTDGGLDLQRWLALQQQYMSNAAALSSGSSADSVISATQQNTADVTNLGEAKKRFTLAQAVANVHIESANFVRDSITGK